jgi:spore germination protein YaaH
MTFVMNEDPRPEDENQDQPEEQREPTPQTPPSTPAVREAQPATPSQAMRPVPPPQGQQPQKRGGCLLPGLIIGFLVLVLVVVGLLLPPFSLLDQLTGPQYVALDADTPGVSHPDGLTLTIDTAQPGDGFGVGLDSVDQATFASGGGADWASAARAALPPALTLVSPVYNIDYEGDPPGAIALRIDTPPGAEPFDTLDLYGYNEATNEWAFIPSQFTEGNAAIVTDTKAIPSHVAAFQTGAAAPMVAIPLDVTQSLSSEVAQVATMVMPAGLQPTIQGTLQGSLAANFQTGAGYAVALSIRNYTYPNALDTSTIETILSSEGLIAEHIRQLAACAQSCYQGGPVDIAIDYRGIDPVYRDQFALFIRELARALHENGRSLTVVVPAAEEGGVGEPWNTGAYDWRTIGMYADYVQVILGNNPVDFVPGGLVERMLRWGMGEVSRYKLQINLSAESFQQVGGDTPDFAPISFEEAVSGLGNVDVITESDLHYFMPGTAIEATLNGMQATTGLDPAAQTPYIEYENGGRVWLTTRSALLYRMSLVKPFNIAGVAIRDLLNPSVTSDTLQAASDFALNAQPAEATVDLALRWTVLSASGAVVEESTTGVGQPFQWNAIEQDGNYAINVAVVSGSEESARGGQQVAVAFPTNTPVPTSTPTPTPTPTNTPVPVVVQQPAAQPSGDSGGSSAPAPAAPAPVSGSISGGFEIGGHVADLNSAVPYMQRAGMSLDQGAGALQSRGRPRWRSGPDQRGPCRGHEDSDRFRWLPERTRQHPA